MYKQILVRLQALGKLVKRSEIYVDTINEEPDKIIFQLNLDICST